MKNIVKQFYQSNEWQRIRTIPHEEGDYFELTKHYTDVTMDVEISGNLHQLTSYEEMFSKIQTGHTNKILVIGQPGHGKTMLVHKIASDWSFGKLPHFDMIFIIKLRYMNSNETVVDAIMKQLWYPDDAKINKDVFESILNSNDMKILIILDGLDEVPFNDFPHISKKVQCNNCNLLVTARPHMIHQVKRYFDSIVTIKGFTKDNIKTLVSKIVGKHGNATEVYERLKYFNRKLFFEDQHEKTAHHCPFFIYVSIHMVMSPTYDESEKRLGIESANIYSEFHFDLIKFIIKTNQMQKNTSDKAVKQSLLDAMELAADVILQNDSALFDIKKLKNEDMWRLGLLSGYKKRIGLAVTTQVEFIHLSIQETLAAFHIIKSVMEYDTGPLETFLQQWMMYDVPKAIVVHNVAVPFTIGMSIIPEMFNGIAKMQKIHLLMSLCMGGGGPMLPAPFKNSTLAPGSLLFFACSLAKFSMLPEFYCLSASMLPCSFRPMLPAPWLI